MTFQELYDKISEHNKVHNITHQFEDKNPLRCVIVFKFDGCDYSLKNRSYEFSSDNKYFLPTMMGNSIFATALDNSETIRLDWYLHDWVIEDCYIMGE